MLRATKRFARFSLITTRALTWTEPLPERGPRERAAGLRWLARGVVSAHEIDVLVEGRVPRGPVVVVSNHVSYLDPLVLASLFGCSPIAKLEVAGWPIVGQLMRRCGTIFVDRACTVSGMLALRRCLGALRAGVPVLAFPEGTTTPGDRLEPFRRGVFGIARRMRVPVVPVAIRVGEPDLAWVGDAAFLPHYFRTVARHTVHLTVRVGAPIDPQHYQSPEILADTARDEIARMLGLLVPVTGRPRNDGPAASPAQAVGAERSPRPSSLTASSA